MFFFFNDTATTEIYTLSLHDALPIYGPRRRCADRAGEPDGRRAGQWLAGGGRDPLRAAAAAGDGAGLRGVDRKSTRLNSSHANISYAVFCLKKKESTRISPRARRRRR